MTAVFTAKKSWRKYADELDSPGLRENYELCVGQDKKHGREVEEQFEKKAALGAMREMEQNDADKELDGVMLASLGAIEKKDGTYRVIHDATHGVGVNSRIIVIDRIRSPNVGDLCRVGPPKGYPLRSLPQQATLLVRTGSVPRVTMLSGSIALAHSVSHLLLTIGAGLWRGWDEVLSSFLANWVGCSWYTLTTCCGSAHHHHFRLRSIGSAHCMEEVLRRARVRLGRIRVAT